MYSQKYQFGGVKLNLNISMELKGIDEAELKVDPTMRKVLWKVMNKIQSIALRLVPVDTGLLRATISSGLHPVAEGEEAYTLTADTNYALFVEYGTVKTRAQPFFRPSLFEVKTIWLPRIWNAVLNRA